MARDWNRVGRSVRLIKRQRYIRMKSDEVLLALVDYKLKF